MADYTETSWTSVQKHCYKLFGYYPNYNQLRFWWFGTISAKRPDLALRKTWGVREVNEWDVVIKLALDYAAKEGNLTTPYKEGDVSRFVYYLLWKSEQVRNNEAKNKKGETFYGQSFWGWAIERRNNYDPFINKTGAKNMKSNARKFLQKMAEGNL